MPLDLSEAKFHCQIMTEGESRSVSMGTTAPEPPSVDPATMFADAAFVQRGITQSGAQVPVASWSAAVAARWARRVASAGWGLSRCQRSECG